MLISRCAWHPFFCGYPRPLRVVSWRGPGIAFADTICRSCAERVRIEGLWGSSPPTPVWPGSAHTALVFVGLPLLVALVLLATPLHDASTPVPREDAALFGDPAVSDPVITGMPTPVYGAVRREATRRPRVKQDPVPAVIFEPRRVTRLARDRASTPPRAVAAAPPTVTPVRTFVSIRRIAEGVPVRPAVSVADPFARSLFREQQSP
jgi:hypothetical protein